MYKNYIHIKNCITYYNFISSIKKDTIQFFLKLFLFLFLMNTNYTRENICGHFIYLKISS